MSHIEKSCSRCGSISWSSQAGGLGQVCKVDKQPCDTSGETYVDGQINIGRLEF